MMRSGTAGHSSEAAEARPGGGGALRGLTLRLRRLVRDLVDDDAIARLEIPLRHLREGGVGQAGDDGNAHGPAVAQDPHAGIAVALPVTARPVVTAVARIAPLLCRGGVAVAVLLTAGARVPRRLLRAVRRE